MYEVQKLVKSGMVSFEDRAPNVKANPLPAHGNSSVNMVEGCPGEFKVFDVCFIRRSLVTMHKEIEVYFDDMIANSRTEVEHVEHLLKLFQRLRKFQLRLNPNKCTFGVRSGKLLGFVVSERGIEVDPAKVKAI